MRKFVVTATRVMTVGMIAAGVAVSGMTHEAPIAPYAPSEVGTAKVMDTRESVSVEWQDSYAETFPGCVEKVAEGVIPSAFVAVTVEGNVKVFGWAEAQKRTAKSGPAFDDIWIVGQCA